MTNSMMPPAGNNILAVLDKSHAKKERQRGSKYGAVEALTILHAATIEAGKPAQLRSNNKRVFPVRPPCYPLKCDGVATFNSI